MSISTTLLNHAIKKASRTSIKVRRFVQTPSISGIVRRVCDLAIKSLTTRKIREKTGKGNSVSSRQIVQSLRRTSVKDSFVSSYPKPPVLSLIHRRFPKHKSLSSNWSVTLTRDACIRESPELSHGIGPEIIQLFLSPSSEFHFPVFYFFYSCFISNDRYKK